MSAVVNDCMDMHIFLRYRVFFIIAVGIVNTPSYPFHLIVPLKSVRSL